MIDHSHQLSEDDPLGRLLKRGIELCRNGSPEEALPYLAFVRETAPAELLPEEFFSWLEIAKKAKAAVGSEA